MMQCTRLISLHPQYLASVPALLQVLSNLNVLLEYSNALLEYIALCAKDSVLNVMVVYWLITMTALMYYCVSTKLLWL